MYVYFLSTYVCRINIYMHKCNNNMYINVNINYIICVYMYVYIYMIKLFQLVGEVCRYIVLHV